MSLANSGEQTCPHLNYPTDHLFLPSPVQDVNNNLFLQINQLPPLSPDINHDHFLIDSQLFSSAPLGSLDADHPHVLRVVRQLAAEALILENRFNVVPVVFCDAASDGQVVRVT